MPHFIAENTKKLRKKLGMTQEELGVAVGVSKAQINNIENNKSNPSMELLSKMILNLKININWYLTDIGEMFLPAKFEDVEDEMTLRVEAIIEKMKKEGKLN